MDVRKIGVHPIPPISTNTLSKKYINTMESFNLVKNKGV
jgi:hypothetical protein